MEADTPSRAACGRAARSSATAASGAAPNLPDRSSTAPPFGSARRTIRPSSPATPVAAISVQDLRQFVGAIEHEVAHAVPRPGLADRAARLDRVHEMDRGVGEHLPHQRAPRPIEAQSKCAHAAGLQRAQHRRLRVALHGVQHVAGKRRRRSRARWRLTVAGRRQCIGSSGRSCATRSSTVGSARGTQRSGGAAARRRSGRAGWSSRKSSRATRPDALTARPASAATKRGRQPTPRAIAPRRRDSADAARTSHRGKPISQHRRLPNDPGPRLAGPTEKDALRRCCAPQDFVEGLAARAMRQDPRRPARDGARSGI